MSSAAIWLIFHLYEPGFPSDPPNPITSTGDLYHHYPMWLTWDTWTVLPHDSLQFIFFLPHILLNVFYTVSQICIPAFRQFLRKVLGGPKRREQKLVWWNNRTSQTRKPHYSDRLVTSVALARGQPHKTAENGKEGGQFLHHLLLYKTEWSKKSAHRRRTL